MAEHCVFREVKTESYKWFVPKVSVLISLFKCLLDSPEITSYLLQSGKLHSGSNVFFTDYSNTGSNFPQVCLAHRLQFFV